MRGDVSVPLAQCPHCKWLAYRGGGPERGPAACASGHGHNDKAQTNILNRPITTDDGLQAAAFRFAQFLEQVSLDPLNNSVTVSTTASPVQSINKTPIPAVALTLPVQ